MKTRELWVDNVKFIACILVATGHFFRSMVESSVIPDSGVHQWFIETIYCFHVPLFFICSGYLYQRYTNILSFKFYFKNIFKKFVVLGVPYFFFSSATWLIKRIASNSVNTKIDSSLFTSLFIEPIAPYWYLYALFFIFTITPTLNNTKICYLFISISIAAQIVLHLFTIPLPYPIYITLINLIWFVGGESLAFFSHPPIFCKPLSLALFITLFISFISLSVFSYISNTFSWYIKIIVGTLACISIIGITIFTSAHTSFFLINYVSKYTMPIFLMHTICAATFRSVLFKMGITSAWIHIPLGLLISFIAPIVCQMILDNIQYASFIIYPNRYIKL